MTLRYKTALAVICATACLLTTAGASAQRLRIRDRVRQPETAPAEEAVAAIGPVFGVGKLTIAAPPGTTGEALNAGEFTLTEKNGRALYPAYVAAAPRRGLIRDVLDRPQSITVYCLFPAGDPQQAAAPLDLTLFAPAAVNRQVTPKNDADLQAQLLAEWWRQYSATAQQQARNNEYPQLIDAWLSGMLSRRLRLPAPDLSQPSAFSNRDTAELVSALTLLSDGESQRTAMVRQIAEGRAPSGAADRPAPAAIAMTEMAVPATPNDLKLEPIAAHVPAECLYIRFGSFNNYQWFRERLEDWGGDIKRLITARGLNSDLSARLERQLSLHETALSKLLGPAVIADVALIGDDAFFKEGAAIGMLFQARNSFALSSDINRQRQEAIAGNKAVKEEKLKIGGHDVSFLSTPDGRVHSYYAVDGEYHLVTTSRAIVERFYDAGAGRRPLSAAADFRYGRSTLPLEREDSIFVFLSGDFFAQLASPQYQIEIARRLRSAAEMDVLQMAQLTARFEGRRPDSIAGLIDSGILPRGFGDRPDGSRLVINDQGPVIDTIRGAEGSFLPIPDMSLGKVTADEAAGYQRFAAAFQSQVGRLDPIAVAVKRIGDEGTRERVEIAARMLPLADKHYQLAQQIFGPAETQHVATSDADIVSGEAILSGNILSFLMGAGAQRAPYHLIAGVRDVEATQPPVQGRLLNILSTMMSTPFYLGAAPTPGFLQIFGVGRPDAPVDADGYSHGLLFWQRQVGNFFLVSPQRETLADVGSRLNVVQVPSPAQLWLHAGDISRSKLTQLANSVGFRRADQITWGNIHLLHSLTTQLGVPAADALDVAERLLDARLVSPVGGHYELVRREGEFPIWLSTGDATGAPPPATTGRPVRDLLRGLASAGSPAPAGYLAPPLDWLRGFDLALLVDQGKLAVDAQILMERQTGQATPAAPAAGSRPAPTPFTAPDPKPSPATPATPKSVKPTPPPKPEQ